METLGFLVNLEILDQWENQVQRVQWVNLAIMVLKVYLVWLESLDLEVLQDLQVHLVKLLECLNQLLEVMLCLDLQAPVDLWDPQVHLVKEEQLVEEDLQEHQECLEYLEALVDQVNLALLDKVEPLEYQECLENLEENIVKMI